MYESLIEIDWLTIGATLINTLLLFFILRRFLYEPVKRMLHSREEEVRTDLEHAKREKDEGTRFREEHSKRLALVGAEADLLLHQAETAAQSRSAELLRDAKTQADETFRRTERQLEKERRRTVIEARKEIAGLALHAAERVLEERLDQAENERLVNRFLDRLENDLDRTGNQDIKE